MSTFQLSLFEPNTLLPHRAGIAGLALALSVLNPEDAPITWEVSDDTVTLGWECTDKEAISWLMQQTYTIQDGLLVVPSLQLSFRGRYPFSKGVLDTFLQFQRGNKEFNPTEENLIFTIEDTEVSIKNRPLLWCYYTEPSKLDIFTSKGAFKPKIHLSSKHFPGLIQDFANSQYYQESIDHFISLLFLPVACSYFRLPFVKAKILKKERWVPTYAIIVPEVYNLSTWVKRRKRMPENSYRNFLSPGAGESGLRFLLQDKLLGDLTTQSVKYCEVIKIGPQPWVENQAGLKQGVLRVAVSDKVIELYHIASQYLPPLRINKKRDEESKLIFSKVLPWIADNLISGKQWYTDFFSFSKKKTEKEVIQPDGSKKKIQIYKYERKGLIAMTEHLEAHEQILFAAVQGSFSNYLRKQFEFRKSKLGRDLNSKEKQDEFSATTDKAIYRLQHPSTRQDFATALVGFLSQFPSKASKGVGREIYAWIHGEEWRKARDLTMLAIVTYQSKKKDGVTDSNDDLVELPDPETETESEFYEESL